jgi:hypothetical protein
VVWFSIASFFVLHHNNNTNNNNIHIPLPK